MARIVILTFLLADVGFGLRCGPREPNCSGTECSDENPRTSSPDDLVAPEELPECVDDEWVDDARSLAAFEVDGSWRVVVLDESGEPCMTDE